MPKSIALVDGIESLSAPTEVLTATPLQPSSQVVTVSFQGGRLGLLDVAAPRSAIWAEVLDSLRQADQPTYVEIDPDSNVITELLVPLTVRVGDIAAPDERGAVEVELIISHARHYLQRANPDFQQLLQIIQTARDQGTFVIVTEAPNTNDIIDVRPLPKTLAPAETVSPEEARAEPALAPAPVTQQRAAELFALVNGKTCCPGSTPAPCIPFQYPDDGCWGRAHEMCRLMINTGVEPQKVWIYGWLRVATANQPQCQVTWGWHVAPTLLVNTPAGVQIQVIDPALFPNPVPQATWFSVQGDPNATLEPSSSEVFYKTRGNGYVEYDSSYSKTQGVLNTYRNKLKVLSASNNGPPPYFNCLSKPAGVQWFGMIAGNATARWFTFGWPAAWDVIWSIMPHTHCPGGPQLSWTVQTERANVTQCTYWITVRNLTADPVKFEGRYDVLKK